MIKAKESMMAQVISLPVRQQLVCSSCGADGEGSCSCGMPYVPAFQRAEAAIAANPDKSDRAIAAEIGVGNKTVSRARGKVTVSPDTVAKRTGKDGKARKLPKKRKPKLLPPGDMIFQQPCTDCNSEEERWQRSVMNLASDAIAMPAFWTREFGKWDQFAVTSDLITLAKQAAVSWQHLVSELKLRKAK